MIRERDTAGVVDRVGVDAPARERVLDPRRLREADVPALAHDLGAHVAPVDPHRVVDPVVHGGVRLARALHIGADPAVPEQVDRCAQDGADQLVAGQRLRVRAQRAAHFGRQRDPLRAALEHPAARTERLARVVAPRRARQSEQAPPLLERGFGRLGIEEHVAVIEGGDEPHPAHQEQAVPEHVARHVADADRRERLALRVAAELREMALHAQPRAARGDRLALVVVAVAAAARESVAEPEAVLGRRAIRGVGEVRRAFVRRHDEVRVVAVVAHDLHRRDGAAFLHVVGEPEQRRDEARVQAVGLGARGGRVCGRPAQREAALRADRHDQAVLHHLRAPQAEHLRADVLRAVAPAQSAARDRPAAQVHADAARTSARRSRPRAPAPAGRVRSRTAA